MINPSVLENFEPLRSVGSSAREALAARAVSRTFRTGQWLWRAGDQSRGLFFVLEGRVRIVRDVGLRQHVVQLVHAVHAIEAGDAVLPRHLVHGQRADVFAGDQLWQIFPLLFLGAALEKRAGEDAAKVLYRLFSFAIPRKYKAISSDKVASAMAGAAAKDMKGTFTHSSRDMQQVTS